MNEPETRPPYCLALVHLGDTLPSHLEDALRQIQLYNRCPVFLLANRLALLNCTIKPEPNVEFVACEDLLKSPHHNQFNNTSPLDREYREGFWHYTCERFFYLEALAASLGESFALYHLENDVLLYRDLEDLHPIFVTNKIEIGGTLDNDTRCIPGMVYFRSANSLKHLNEFIVDVIKLNVLPQVNDMILLAAYWRTFGNTRFSPLPVVPSDYSLPMISTMGHTPKESNVYSHLYESFGSIFDAAALGQYLAGVDPRNAPLQTPGTFQNESAVYSAESLQIQWRENNGLTAPLAITSHGVVPINNLHIHSKNLARFRSDLMSPTQKQDAPQQKNRP